MSKNTTNELNESIEPLTDAHNTEEGVDDFLEAEKNVSKAGGSHSKSGRPKSTVKSLRESIGYTSTNKFGEGRRVMEADDEDGDNRISIKQR